MGRKKKDPHAVALGRRGGKKGGKARWAMVPPAEMAIARQQLAGALVGVISQRLAMSTQASRRPVVEVLRGDSVTTKYILEGKITDLADYIATGENKMQTFDMHAVELFRQGILPEAEALRVASNPEAVKFKMRAEGTSVKASLS